MKEKQELHCHSCGLYVRFDLDLSVDGNYVLECPNCGHKHYRCVKNGIITDERWERDPSQAIFITAASVSANSYYLASTYNSVSTLWVNLSSTC